MKAENYNTSVLVAAAPEEVFRNISAVSKWWTTDIEGQTENLHAVFTIHFGKTYITLKVIESIPFSSIRWLVVDCNKDWLKNKKEWKDTEIDWKISREGDKIRIDFTHTGLIPGMECYEGCEKAWTSYITDSFFHLFTRKKEATVG